MSKDTKEHYYAARFRGYSGILSVATHDDDLYQVRIALFKRFQSRLSAIDVTEQDDMVDIDPEAELPPLKDGSPTPCFIRLDPAPVPDDL